MEKNKLFSGVGNQKHDLKTYFYVFKDVFRQRLFDSEILKKRCYYCFKA